MVECIARLVVFSRDDGEGDRRNFFFPELAKFCFRPNKNRMWIVEALFSFPVSIELFGGGESNKVFVSMCGGGAFNLPRKHSEYSQVNLGNPRQCKIPTGEIVSEGNDFFSNSNSPFKRFFF